MAPRKTKKKGRKGMLDAGRIEAEGESIFNSLCCAVGNERVAFEDELYYWIILN